VAGKLGRWDEAEAGLRSAVRRFATGDHQIRLGLAEMLLTRATAEGMAGRLDAAVTHALRTREELAGLPPPRDAAEADRRAAILAVAAGLRADVARLRGDAAGAIALYREALAQGGRVPGREAWADRLRRLEAAGPR
jgi:hypothetical protein